MMAQKPINRMMMQRPINHKITTQKPINHKITAELSRLIDVIHDSKTVQEKMRVSEVACSLLPFLIGCNVKFGMCEICILFVIYLYIVDTTACKMLDQCSLWSTKAKAMRKHFFPNIPSTYTSTIVGESRL